METNLRFRCVGVHRLESVTLVHSEGLLQLRNRDEVRKWFRSSDRVSEADHEKWMAQYWSRGDEKIWVLLCDDRVIGAGALYGIKPEHATANFGRLMTEPSSRKTHYGAGRMILRHAIEYARHMGISRLLLEVKQNNRPARNLYQSEGFALAGIEDGYLDMFLDLR